MRRSAGGAPLVPPLVPPLDHGSHRWVEKARVAPPRLQMLATFASVLSWSRRQHQQRRVRMSSGCATAPPLVAPEKDASSVSPGVHNRRLISREVLKSDTQKDPIRESFIKDKCS